MAEQEQFESQHNILPLDWSSWSAGPMQQHLSTTILRYLPPFDGCNGSPPYPAYYHSPLPGFISTNQQHSDEPETPHHEESQDSEESTVVFSASKYHYLDEEEQFILNPRLRQEPWKVTREAYMTQFNSFPYESPNILNMEVCRLKEKYPKVKAILEKSNIIKKVGRSIKRKKSQTA
ncbi:hypothetical protein LZ30DRAFT_410404 [Colletotrichum cereale]|nr:hypothetical protein LZ30DRAFT_410404 [Colletotrichum cereale]